MLKIWNGVNAMEQSFVGGDRVSLSAELFDLSQIIVVSEQFAHLVGTRTLAESALCGNGQCEENSRRDFDALMKL